MRFILSSILPAIKWYKAAVWYQLLLQCNLIFIYPGCCILAEKFHLEIGLPPGWPKEINHPQMELNPCCFVM
jgi:hypothetical protein